MISPTYGTCVRFLFVFCFAVSSILGTASATFEPQIRQIPAPCLGFLNKYVRDHYMPTSQTTCVIFLRNGGYVVLYFKFSSCYTLGPESLLPSYHVEQPPVGREPAEARIHSSHTIFKGYRLGIWDYGCRSHSNFAAFNRICCMESRLAATSEPRQLPTAGVRVDIKVSLILGVPITPV
jgi:hypothetical protein